MSNKIYRISRNDDWDYDEFDSFVIVAKSEAEAVSYDPYGKRCDDPTEYSWDKRYFNEEYKCYTHFRDFEVSEIGVCTKDIYPGTIICSSFNAG